MFVIKKFKKLKEKLQKILKNYKQRKNLIKDLIKRRDEVVKRTALVLNRKIPENLLDASFGEIMEWMISPHIKSEYEIHAESNPELRREAEAVVYSAIKSLKESKEFENLNTDIDNDIDNDKEKKRDESIEKEKRNN